MNYLTLFDYSPDSISFFIKGKKNFPLIIGGIFNILILITAATLLNLFSSDMINKLNPIIFSQINTDEDNRTIDINDPKINVIIQTSYKNGTQDVFNLDPTIFTIVALFQNYSTSETGEKNQTSTIIPLKFCNESDFDSSFSKFFRKNNLDTTAFCMSTKDYKVIGQYTSSIFQFLSFKIVQCNGVDFRTGNKVKCVSKAERNLRITNYKASIYFTYSIPDLVSYENPVSTQTLNLAYTFNPTTYSKDNFFFSADDLYTDDGWFPSSKNFDTNNKPLSIVSFSNLQPTIASSSTLSNDIYLSFYYRVQPSYYYTRRIYKKITDILPQIYPFIQFAILFTQFVASKIRNYSLINLIIDDAFNIKNEEGIKHLKKLKGESEKNKMNHTILNTKDFNFRDNERIDIENAKSTDNSKRKLNLLSSTNLIENNVNSNHLTKLNKLQSGDKALQIDIFKKNLLAFTSTNRKKEKYIGSLFKYMCRRSERLIYKELNSRIKNTLEINTYLNMYNEIEKLQCLILNKDQKNCIPLWNYNYLSNCDGIVITDWLNKKNDTFSEERLNSYNNLLNVRRKKEIDSLLISKISEFNLSQ